jgi:hypothetical protein
VVAGKSVVNPDSEQSTGNSKRDQITKRGDEDSDPDIPTLPKFPRPNKNRHRTTGYSQRARRREIHPNLIKQMSFVKPVAFLYTFTIMNWFKTMRNKNPEAANTVLKTN